MPLAGSANNVYNLVVTQLLQNYGGTGAQIYFNIPTNMLNQTLIIAQLPIGSVFTELEKKGNGTRWFGFLLVLLLHFR